MAKKPPSAETLLAFIQAYSGLVATLTPEQLAEQTGYTLSEAKEYYEGVAQEKQRLAEAAADERFHIAKAEVITWISACGPDCATKRPIICGNSASASA